MKKIIFRHKELWLQKAYAISALTGFAFLILSLAINRVADNYTLIRASNHVTDIILDNIPVFNIDFIFFDLFATLLAFTFFLQLCEPKTLPFFLKSLALFIVIRSIFISLTHIAVPLNHSYLDPNDIFRGFTSEDDLFFSSHTGIPFLFVLLYWENKPLRWFFLTASIFFGVAVLLGHLHYSIDVFSAFFITYGIYHIAMIFFKKDYERFLGEINAT